MRNPEHVLSSVMTVPLPRDHVFAFFAAAENLERITPPELRFQIVTPLPIEMRAGALIEYRLGLAGIRFTWRTEISSWRPPHEFVDTQVAGPYAQWVHTHRFRDTGGGTEVEDEVRYRLPVPLLGEAAYPLVRLQLGRIFRYRQRRMAELLQGRVDVQA
jgi:ligand-binding SRPBCC domain-containing protein